MTYEVAKRKAVPILFALTGTSGSGKTYSGLLAAAGMAGPNGKVGMIDTESGRGSMYADDVDIIAAMPGGQYFIKELCAPFTPEKYGQAIKEAMNSGVTVLLIDSMSHEYEGMGGMEEIAAAEKTGWLKPKMRHRREVMNVVTQTPMDIIFCLREREKTKVMKDDNGKDKFVAIGMQPIQEKNFMYEMTISMRFDCGNPGKPILTKCPKPLRHLFVGEQAIVTKEVGAKIKLWAQQGEQIDMRLRNIKRECREAAMLGSVALDDFFRGMEKDDKDLLKKLASKEFQEEVRALAAEADNVMASSEEPEESTKLFNN